MGHLLSMAATRTHRKARKRLKRLGERTVEGLVPVTSRAYGGYIGWVARSTRWHRIGFEPWEAALAEGRPFILAHWHGRLSLCLHAFDFGAVPYTGLSFDHPAAAPMTQDLQRRGAEVLRLSRKGPNTAVLRGAVRALRGGRLLGIAPDGPQGPAREAKPGIVDIASLSGCPVAPISFAVSRFRRLATWDSFVLPLPHGRGVMAMGAPVLIPRSLDAAARAHWQARIGAALDATDAACDAALAALTPGTGRD